MVKKSSTQTAATAYENNPFFVATNGIELLFKKAQSVGITLAILAGLSLFSYAPSWAGAPADSGTSTPAQDEANAKAFVDGISAIPVEVWFLIGSLVLLFVLVFTFVGVVIRGVSDFTAASLARGETLTLRDALKGLFANFWGYVWVQIIVGVKTFLWTLLFIVPGFVMAYRYSLAGVTFFDKKLAGNASVTHSASLTKGAWLTTYASQSLLNMLTFGVIAPLLMPGTNAVLYRQLESAGTQKPSAHFLSWLTLLLPFILVLVFGLLIVGVVLLIVNSVAP